MSQPSHSEQAGILALGKILATIAEAVVLLVIVRLLGKVEVGILAGLLLIYQTIALVLTAGFPATLMFHLPARPPGERRAIAWKVARALFVLGIVAGLVLLGLSRLGEAVPGVIRHLMGGGPGTTEQPPLRYLAGLALLPMADLPARMLPNLLVIENRARAAAGVGIVYSLGQSVSIVLPLALGFDLWAVVACIVGFGYVYGTLLLYYLAAIYRGTPSSTTAVTTVELFRFAIPLGATDTIAILNNRLDRYLILLFLPLTRFAEYQAGAWQIPMITTIPYAVGTAFAPRFAELFKEGKPREAIAIWRQSIQKVALIVVPITSIFIVSAEETVELLFTEDYGVAAGVFRLYAIFTLGRVAAFGTVIVAAGRPGFVLQAALFSFLSNLAISLPLVVLIGFEGPALGTVLAFIPTIGFYCWCIGRAAGLRFREIFPLAAYSKVIGLAALACSGAVALKLCLDLPVATMLALEGLCVLGSFALLGTLLRQITREDWRFVWDWLRLRVLFRSGS